MIAIIALLVMCVVLLAILIGLSVYTIYRDTTKMQNNLDIQIAAATSSKLPEIHKLPYSELMDIVNKTIDYYTTHNLTVNTLSTKSGDEISVQLDDLSADIATTVKLSVSPLVSNCITSYVSEDFYDRYILTTVRLLLVAHIEKLKRSGRPNPKQQKNHTP